MNSFEEEVQYFINLVFSNMQVAKTKNRKREKEEAIFFNVNVKLDGTEVALWNTEKDFPYSLFTKDIKDFNFKHSINQSLALRYIENLTKYLNNQITVDEYLEMSNETNPNV